MKGIMQGVFLWGKPSVSLVVEGRKVDAFHEIGNNNSHVLTGRGLHLQSAIV